MIERYPATTKLISSPPVTDALATILKDSENATYWDLEIKFRNAARVASEAEDFEISRVLWLSSDILSLQLKPESTNEPFGPKFVVSGKRSAISSDFTDEEIEFLLAVAEQIQNTRFKARIYDLAWIHLNPRNITNAIEAIRYYTSVTISVETWHCDVGLMLERAIQLGRMLREPARKLITNLESSLLNKTLSATSEQGYLPLWIVSLLMRYGLSVSEYESVSAKMISLGEEFSISGNRQNAKDYFLLGSKCYLQIKKYEQSNTAIVRCIDEWEHEASEVDQKDRQCGMRLAWIYESAIKLIRTVRRDFRPGLGLDVRLDSLRSRLTEANQSIIQNMTTIISPPIDISDTIQHARDTVGNKTATEALHEMFNIIPYIDEMEFRKRATENLKQHSLQNFISSVHYTHDGRVARRVPGSNFNGEEEPEQIWAEMMKDFVTYVDIYTRALIWPALEQVRLEHRLTQADFITICEGSAIVPPGREVILGRALYYGFDIDFLLSTHLLTSQLENLVRYHLKHAGAKTTYLDNQNIETENGLSTLVNLPEMEIVFGKSITFIIKAMFCDSLGPNLRNEIAHGLLGDGHFITANTIFAWWFIGRLIFTSYYQYLQSKTVPNE